MANFPSFSESFQGTTPTPDTVSMAVGLPPIVVGASSGYRATVMADSPVAYYRLDEASGTTILDSSGNGLNGTLTTYGSGSVATQGVTGLITGTNTAIRLVEREAVNLGNPAALKFGSAAWSLEAWVNIPVGQPNACAVITQRYDGSTVNFMLGFYDGSAQTLKPTVGFFNGSWRLAQAGSDISLGTTHHIVGTWSGPGGTLRIYVDGALSTSNTPGSNPSTSSTQDFRIAQRWDDPGGVINPYHGDLDEVAIYGSELTAARVLAHYQAGTTSGVSLTATSAQTLPHVLTHAGADVLAPITAASALRLPTIRSASAAAPPPAAIESVTGARPYLDLNHQERKAYNRALLKSHRVRSKVTVYDGNERVAHDLDIADGQVDLDMTSEVTRSASLTIVDPKLKFSWGPMGDIYLDKSIGIKYLVEVRELDTWVEVDVFRGPVSGYSREGHQVNIEAQGKEALMLTPVKQLAVPSLVSRNEVQQVDINNLQAGDSFQLALGVERREDFRDGKDSAASRKITLGQNYTAAGIEQVLENYLGHGKVIVTNVSTTDGFKVQFAGRMEGTDIEQLFVVGGTGSVDGSSEEVIGGLSSVQNRHVKHYIRRVASQYGETKFDLADAGNVSVPKTFNLDPSKAAEKGVWPYLKEVADSVDMELFYDGRGYLCLADVNRNHIVHSFDTDVLTEPQVGIDLSEVRNQVDVYGQDKNGHDVLKARVSLADHHPLSARALGRNGHRRVLLEEIKLDNTRLTLGRAKQIAERHLSRRSKAAMDVQFDSLPIPHIDGGDLCELVGFGSGGNTEFVLQSFSLPLGPASMSVGYHRAKPVHKFRSKTSHLPYEIAAKRKAAAKRQQQRRKAHKAMQQANKQKANA